jgi:hypothetical protein
VCRQIYDETATLAYSINTFILDSGDNRYSGWIDSLSIAHQQAIVSLEYNKWRIMDDILGQVPSGTPRSLKSTKFPSLKHCYVPFQTLESYKEWCDSHPTHESLSSHSMEKFASDTIERGLERYEGNDLIVEFQSYEAPGSLH